jgi:hypothetical protein
MTSLTEQARLKVHARLVNDMPYFCEQVLKIKSKEGELVPFKFNKAQQYLHECIEQQRQDLGLVRIIIVKGRQQGCSTYVSARFYKKAVHENNKSIYILSHETKSTDNLFYMVQRFRGESPDPARPAAEIDNRRQLKLKNQSEYNVGTAGAGTTGRGQTNQYFHGSEVAFWETSEQIVTGVLQTVADIPGTEIILESTGNGVGNFFHRQTMEALEGNGLYRVVFIPWYWQDEYRSLTLPTDFEPTEDERQLVRLYGLDNRQLMWRRNKIAQLGTSKFKQEYPFTVHEAFQASGDSLIDPAAVELARQSKVTDNVRPVVFGVDPARKGDRTVITVRQGRKIHRIDVHKEMDEMLLVGILTRMFKEWNPKKCFIDIASGAGAYDRLCELGYGKVMTAVHFGSKAIDGRFMNKRAEMAFALKEWIEAGLQGDGEDAVNIPDDEDVATDLLVVPDYKESSSNKIFLAPKAEIKKIYGKSTDIFDSIMLTFAFPVKSDTIESEIQKQQRQQRHSRVRLKTLDKMHPNRYKNRRRDEEDF